MNSKKTKSTKELKPVVATETWSDPLQTEIERLFYTLFFAPLMQELTEVKSNAASKKSIIIQKLESEDIAYINGAFEGERSSLLAKAFKSIGASFSKQRKAWIIPVEKLPVDIRNAIGQAIQKAGARERALASSLNNIHDTIKQIIPQFSFQGLSRETLLKMADKVRSTIPNEMAIQPKIDEQATKQLNKGYTDNIQLSIKGFLDDEVLRFRQRILPNIRQGMSRQELRKYISSRLGVGKERAKFIARQETSLFTSKLKEVQYQEAGIEKYRWKAIGGSSGDGRTREEHMEAHGKTFFWDHSKNPKSVRNDKGIPVHPGEDFGCRCQAVPIVEEI